MHQSYGKLKLKVRIILFLIPSWTLYGVKLPERIVQNTNHCTLACLFVFFLILSHSLPGFSDEAQAVLRINKIVKADSYSKALGISSEPYVEKSSEI